MTNSKKVNEQACFDEGAAKNAKIKKKQSEDLQDNHKITL
jgi:hypothetical protein